MEDLSLTTPTQVPSYRVQKLVLDWQREIIKAALIAPGGERVVCTYRGEEALTLMTQLNKLDLSVNSLHKRLLQRLVADGKLPAGTITGEPD